MEATFSARSACIGPDDGHSRVDIAEVVRQVAERWLDSESSQKNVLDPHYRQLSIGIAWDDYNYVIYPHFETDHIEYNELPHISDGKLKLSGALPGMVLDDDSDLVVQIHYSPTPQELTRGQLTRTGCYTLGRLVAQLSPPPPEGFTYTSYGFDHTDRPCPSPFDVPDTAPAPASYDEQVKIRKEVTDAPRPEREYKGRWLTSHIWDLNDDKFDVAADITKTLDEYGPGVYTIRVWATVEVWNTVPISTYSIFYRVSGYD